ncbi:RnfABCDGE type electron transport complex subunit D [Desulfoglaeba alkanexedens]|uniref:Ion-translocating oxidoreductase complex subunit D n=1 Tax=Desulfoglaeba alkanexedens ALDC TaxID=980445 RepID=A0A4V1ERY9_9BACT|nr:RnfABCDGE type electron transport complex subunit D [Desulfoglaeba alkanexedens]QCQ23301.1 RnfABCDGE type electron transport complex subunit D [Desulfoglaeba alkanexedens ALDC]
MKRPDLLVSMPPHVHAGYSIRRMMTDMLIALLPCIFAGWFFFGVRAVWIVALCAVTAPVTEALWLKALRRPVYAADGSAVVTGVLLGLVLSPEVPWWCAVLGTVTAIIVGKELYGGVGSHPFSSVLVGWAFVFISYGVLLEYFPPAEPRGLLAPGGILEYPPQDTLKLYPGPEGLAILQDVPLMDLFLGNVPGTAGTTSVLAVLVGGLYLLARRVIRWHIPVFFVLSTYVFAFISWKLDPAASAPPLVHVLSGWVMLGGFFLATERGTCPVTVPGMILYGIGCGCLTMIIRIWGTYMEGVPFAILLMNGMTPILDRLRPKVIGRVKEVA